MNKNDYDHKEPRGTWLVMTRGGKMVSGFVGDTIKQALLNSPLWRTADIVMMAKRPYYGGQWQDDGDRIVCSHCGASFDRLDALHLYPGSDVLPNCCPTCGSFQRAVVGGD